MGFATAQQFINENGKVIITGRSAGTVNKALEKLGANAFGIVSDAGSMKDIFCLRQQIEQSQKTLTYCLSMQDTENFLPLKGLKKPNLMSCLIC